MIRSGRSVPDGAEGMVVEIHGAHPVLFLPSVPGWFPAGAATEVDVDDGPTVRRAKGLVVARRDLVQLILDCAKLLRGETFVRRGTG